MLRSVEDVRVVGDDSFVIVILGVRIGADVQARTCVMAIRMCIIEMNRAMVVISWTDSLLLFYAFKCCHNAEILIAVNFVEQENYNDDAQRTIDLCCINTM